MAFTLSFDVEVKAARRKLRNYQRRKLPTIIVRTLNRTITGGRTDGTRLLSRRIGMTKTNIRHKLKLNKATGAKLWAEMFIKRERVPNLSRFGAKAQRKSVRGKKRLAGKGVRAKVWERRMLYPRTFLWERSTKSGPAGTVFKRKKGAKKEAPRKGSYAGRRIKRGPRKGQLIKRQPLEPVFGTALDRVFTQNPKIGKSVKEELKPMLTARFVKEFNRQVNRL